MAKKNEQAAEKTAEKTAEQAPEPRYVTSPATHRVYAGEPVPHETLVTAGFRFRVIPDGGPNGKGRPIDDVRRTVWASYAAAVESAEDVLPKTE